VRVKICGPSGKASLASRPHHECPEAIQTFQIIHDSTSPYQPNPPLINPSIANIALALLPEFGPINLANNVESDLSLIGTCPSRGERHTAQPSSSAAPDRAPGASEHWNTPRRSRSYSTESSLTSIS
jgi:hypothetical protein